MKISVIGAQFPDSLAHNISYTLNKMGHSVQNVDQDAFAGIAHLRHRFRRTYALVSLHPRMQSLRDARVVRALTSFGPDLVLNTTAEWTPGAVASARAALGRATRFAFLYPDPTANLGREYPLVSDYDVLYFKDPWAVELYRTRLGINAQYLPEACNPDWHCPVALTAADRARFACDLTTAGNMYYYRSSMLQALSTHELRIWGNNYPRWLRSPLQEKYQNVYVACQEKSKAFGAAKIVINTLSRNEVHGTNARTFEAAGAGAFQLVDWRPALEDLFCVDKEIVVFRSREELRSKVAYYLEHPDERRTIAEAGRRRAHADHTYEQRLKQVLVGVCSTA